MPNSFSKLPSEQLKKTVMQALVFKNFKSNWPDYTVYTFNAYRALEGHLRYILSEVGIDFASKLNSKEKPMTSSFYMFDKEKLTDGNFCYILQDTYHVEIENKFGAQKADFIKYLTDTYSIISDERNSYFHWKKFESELPIDETSLVEDENAVRSIVIKCLTQIEKYYRLYR